LGESKPKDGHGRIIRGLWDAADELERAGRLAVNVTVSAGAGVTGMVTLSGKTTDENAWRMIEWECDSAAGAKS